MAGNLNVFKAFLDGLEEKSQQERLHQIKLSLLKTATRLQTQANSCRGTVCDDDKVPALVNEIDALMLAIGIISKLEQ